MTLTRDTYCLLVDRVCEELDCEADEAIASLEDALLGVGPNATLRDILDAACI